MFKYFKFKIIVKSENPHWIMNSFCETEKVLEGRIVVFKDGTRGNHQIKHPNYSNWLDVPKTLIQIID